MTFLEILSIASNVITVGLYLYNLFSVKNVKLMKKIFGNPYLKVLILSLVFTLVVFTLPSTCKYICQPCVVRGDTVVKHDTIIKRDTFLKTIYASVPKKNEKQPQQYSQKIDNGGSGIQNNAPNYGNQSGRDMTVNNYGTVPRLVTEETMSNFLKMYPDRRTHIAFCYLGSPDGEMLNFKSKITDFLRMKGYNNIRTVAAMGSNFQEVKVTYFQLVRIYGDSTVEFEIPPSQ